MLMSDTNGAHDVKLLMTNTRLLWGRQELRSKGGSSSSSMYSSMYIWSEKETFQGVVNEISSRSRTDHNLRLFISNNTKEHLPENQIATVNKVSLMRDWMKHFLCCYVPQILPCTKKAICHGRHVPLPKIVEFSS